MVMLGMTAVGALLLMYLMYQPSPAAAAADDDDDSPEPPPPPRNFTSEQLHVSGVECCHGYGFRRQVHSSMTCICMYLPVVYAAVQANLGVTLVP